MRGCGGGDRKEVVVLLLRAQAGLQLSVQRLKLGAIKETGLAILGGVGELKDLLRDADETLVDSDEVRQDRGITARGLIRPRLSGLQRHQRRARIGCGGGMLRPSCCGRFEPVTLNGGVFAGYEESGVLVEICESRRSVGVIDLRADLLADRHRGRCNANQQQTENNTGRPSPHPACTRIPRSVQSACQLGPPLQERRRLCDPIGHQTPLLSESATRRRGRRWKLVAAWIARSSKELVPVQGAVTAEPEET